MGLGLLHNFFITQIILSVINFQIIATIDNKSSLYRYIRCFYSSTHTRNLTQAECKRMSVVKKEKRFRGVSKDATWKKLGFLPSFKKGKEGEPKKYRALCIHCRKCQSNTSIDRLIIHRKSCSKFREDLTEELATRTGSGAVESKPAESKFSISTSEPEATASTIEISTSSLLDKLLDEDESSGRNPETTLVSYLSDLDQLVIPQSDANRLQKDLIKAETEYLEAKSDYFTKMNEIAELKRTVTMLEAKKTQLEIVKLRAECE
ncbi:uncharacterized protein LOC108099588 [Drosophila ficusphila]|uniref:uncharacterized protein LOC108099588 n=1 Tax=Drosophila ficusphila TaxID=30025 RepID=UPI0007E7FD2E|nr:uncharacterized protein LOC108099588 [Drosophila ficusphila]